MEYEKRTKEQERVRRALWHKLWQDIIDRSPESGRDVYLLHLSNGLHYCGSATNVEARLKMHGTDRGAKMLKAFAEQGVEFLLARVWKEAGFEKEYRLKASKNLKKQCPICKGGC